MILSPPKIDLLPEHLIDQIKAGEVIERPGSLIKEILENAIDAGATKLELQIKNNGLDLISLKDNGHGMSFNDLPLAFSRHATSKITRFEDLYHLRSFGFRGEALASIAAISRLQCHSFTTSGGSEIKIEGGQTIYHGKKQIEHGQGTELVIQDLFFNTPARLKFIQSQQAEKQFLKKTVFAFILSNPQIEFHLKFDDEEKEIFNPCTDLKSRIEEIVPKSKGLLLHSERFYENNELELYLIPSYLKTPIKWQYIFINGRFVLDKQLHKVLTNAVQASFGEEDFHYIAFFNLPLDHIDVNVHPSKTLIKCLETSKMISLLSSTVKEMATNRKNSAQTATPTRSENPTSFFPSLESSPTLLQERHAYNMEGLFSPHNLPQEKTDFLWVGNFFIKQNNQKWLAVNCRKLLENYILIKLQNTSSTIPLLVSEPFSAKSIKKEIILKLQNAGLELEYLGAETLVLRGIPDWMNGFPLKEIVATLLQEKDLSEISINPSDWSTSTWEEMLLVISPEDLREKRIGIDLETLLMEKLK